MTKSQSVLRVFLASPGDLERERHVVRAVVDDLNASLASRIGFHLELRGWEDTLPGYGRPQEIINQDLDQCEYFIGLVWERWGSPTGKYSSGFEEEYEIAIASRQRDGSPDIAIYLKDIDPGREKDPGEQLKHVLDFRGRLISERKVLFDTFSNEAEIERKVRSILTEKLLTLWQTDDTNRQDSNERDETGDDEKTSTDEIEETTRTFLSDEELDFLRDIEKLGSTPTTKQLDRLHVARMRVLSNALWAEGNDDVTIGPHDANILFLSRDSIKLSRREIIGLVDAGIAHFPHQNAPLWHWLYGSQMFGDLWLPLCTIGGPIRRQSAAIDVLRLVEGQLPSSGKLEKSDYLQSWMRDDQPQEVKIAAIRYIEELGTSSDIKILLGEIERGDYRTVRAAKNAVLVLALADSRTKAIKLLLQHQLDSINDSVLDRIFGDGEGIDSSLLKSCLEHREGSVRSRAAKILRMRNDISFTEIEPLLSDENVLVRYEAVMALLKIGQSLQLNEARRVLVRKTGGGLFVPHPTTVGEKEYSAYRDAYLLAMSEKELISELESKALYDQDSLFALCRKRFSKYEAQLVSGLKNHFSDEFDAALKRLRTMHGGENAVSGAESLRGFVTKETTKKGLSVLCELAGADALPLVRRLISDLEVPLNPQIAGFFGKFGEWDDIALVAEAASRSDYSGGATLLGGVNQYRREAASAIYAIGNSRLADLAKLAIDEDLAARAIAMCSAKAMRLLSDDELLDILNDKRDEVRRVIALKSVQYLSKRRLKKLLTDYGEGESYRYYNSIFWLDLGVSASKARAVRTAKKAIKQME